MTPNQHFYAICCRLDVAGDVISSETVKTIEGYVELDFEVASFISFRDINKRKKFRDGGTRQTSTIALSENAFAFGLKIKLTHDFTSFVPSVTI